MKNIFSLFVSPVGFVASSVTVVAIACSAGCSSSSDGGDGEKKTEDAPSGEEQAILGTELCESRLSTCTSPEKAAAKRESCRAGNGLCEARVAQRLTRLDGTRAFIACMKGRVCGLDDLGNCQCNKSDDACHREVGIAMPASPRRDAYVAACQAKLAEGGKADSFLDDWCTTGGFGYEIFNDATYDALAPCFSKACGENTIGTCLRTTHDQVAGETC